MIRELDPMERRFCGIEDDEDDADADITYSLTLFYPSSHALKMTQVEVTAVATSTAVDV